MKLFANEVIKPNFSTEQFVAHYLNTNSTIAQENLSDYFFKIKDMFVNTYNSLSSATNDKIVLDNTASKFETLHKLKRVKYTDIKDYITSKPENFRGKYIDYTLDLINSSKIITENTEATLNNLKLAIASFINEYADNKASTLYGAVYFKEATKLVEENTKELSKYFVDTNSSSKTYIKDVLKSQNDIESLYKNIEVLDTILNQTKINYIAKLTNECADLIDSLMDQNSKTNILANNNSTKKDLINAIHAAAKEVEFLNYLYSNAVIFYSTFGSLVSDLNRVIDAHHQE